MVNHRANKLIHPACSYATSQRSLRCYAHKDGVKLKECQSSSHPMTGGRKSWEKKIQGEKRTAMQQVILRCTVPTVSMVMFIRATWNFVLMLFQSCGVFLFVFFFLFIEMVLLFEYNRHFTFLLSSEFFICLIVPPSHPRHIFYQLNSWFHYWRLIESGILHNKENVMFINRLMNDSFCCVFFWSVN